MAISFRLHCAGHVMQVERYQSDVNVAHVAVGKHSDRGRLAPLDGRWKIRGAERSFNAPRTFNALRCIRRSHPFAWRISANQVFASCQSSELVGALFLGNHRAPESGFSGLHHMNSRAGGDGSIRINNGPRDSAKVWVLYPEINFDRVLGDDRYPREIPLVLFETGGVSARLSGLPR